MVQFHRQLQALLIRILQQKRRDLSSLFLELLIPLVFTAIIIILWSLFGSEEFVDTEMFTYPNLQYTGNPDMYTAYVCYNSSDGNVIDGLFPCSNFGFNATCPPNDDAIPVKGLCHDANYTLETIVGYYLKRQLCTPYQLPPFDSVVIHQWLAALSGSFGLSAARATLSSVSGLATATRFSAIGCYGSLYFAPASNIPASLIDYFNTTTKTFKHVYGGVFDTIEAALEFVRTSQGRHWGIVEIRSMSPDNFDVAIHLNRSASPPLDVVVNRLYPGGYSFDGSDVYATSGFLPIQQILSEYFLEQYTNKKQDTTLYLSSMGIVAFDRSLFLVYAGIMAPFILVLSFLYSVSRLTKMMVLEKELRIREAMLIMGLNMTPMYISWLLVYVVQYLIECFFVTLMLKLTLFQRSNALIIFLVVYLFALTTIPLAGLLSTFFNKARVASLLAPLIYFVSSLPLFAVTSSNGSIILGLSILSPTAFSSAMSTIVDHEVVNGFHSGDFNNPNDSPPLTLILIMLAVAMVLYTLLMLYFDAVLPKTWGTSLHPLFFITAPFRFLTGLRRTTEFVCGKDGRCENGVFEQDLHPHYAVQLQGLRKVFRRGGKEFVAVNNLYWAMKQDEISVLLGHNGAGKSTTMNMMTGMLEPDEGDCLVYGKSVRRNLSSVRKEVGFCPQHNILWPELTCREHLEFFGRINGMHGPDLDSSVAELVAAVDLGEKEHTASSRLSGGQKRKLSVALAFVGCSRLVYLDEPTAGMDVGARRHTWDLLQRMAHRRTVLLTTHYMDEADLLSHRIGIMSHGRLKCSGSSLFLKSRLGLGYNLTLSVQPDTVSETSITALVRRFVPSADLVSINRCELAYRLSTQYLLSIPSLLAVLDTSAKSFDVRSYCLSSTTLEEVFISLSVNDTPKESDPILESSSNNADFLYNNVNDTSESFLLSPHFSTTGPTFLDDCVLWRPIKHARNCQLLHHQFRQMMKKRLFSAMRDKKMIFFQIVCPVMCILLAMLLNLIDTTRSGSVVMASTSYGAEVEMDLWNCEEVFGVSPVVDGAVVHTKGPVVNESQTMSASQVSTWWTHPLPRYGSTYCMDRMAAILMEKEAASVLFYNTSSYHEVGIGVANYYNGVYRAATGASQVMKLTAKTMPMTEGGKKENNGVKTILIGTIIMIPFTFLPANVVAWVVKERECGARHLQRVSGVRFSVYWLSNCVFDLAAYTLTAFLIVIIFVIFQRTEYIALAAAGPTIVLLAVFGLTSTAMAYMLSFLFNEHSNAQIVVMAMSFVSGFLLVMLVFIMSIQKKTQDASEKLRWVFRLVPSYCIGEGIINLALRGQQLQYTGFTSAWGMDVIGWPCVYMGVELPFFVAMTLLLDHARSRMWLRKWVVVPMGNAALFSLTFVKDLGCALAVMIGRCFRGGGNRNFPANGLASPAEPIALSPDEERAAMAGELETDSDVEEEREQVMNDPRRQADLVRVVRLHHQYPNGKVAVKDVTFGIHPGEVFALLGTNGAGKTTTTAVLCQAVVPTAGHAFMCGIDVTRGGEDALKWTGYCPQFDALLDLLTTEEHLRMYCGIRGIVPAQQDDVVACLLELFQLQEYRGTLAHELSGGNQRKLSVAISLIGGPHVVLLDEPSAGMDPVARRGLWSAINTISSNCAVMLTTHHLEEVEALAHRVAIMVDGTLRCIGDKTHLKNKFGSGFEMSLRVASEEGKKKVEDFVAKSFPGSTLNEYHGLRYVYAVPREWAVGNAIELLLKYKDKLGITDYAVSHTSIEQVFLKVLCEDKRVANH